MAKRRNIIIGTYIVIAIVSAYISASDGGDFDVYLQAARQLGNGENIYAPPFVKGLPYFYSVFFAFILTPFTKYVFFTEFIWLLLTFVLLVRIKKLIVPYFNISILSEKERRNWLLLAILLSLQFVMYDISLIQITTFLLWSILESLHLIQNKKAILAGIILGTVINIKIMPVLILPYLFYRGYFKTLITSITCFLILLYLPGLFMGKQYNTFLLNEWWKVINPSNKEHMFETEIGPHSLVACLPVFLTQTDGEMPFRRNILNLQPSTVELIVNAFRLVLVFFSIFFLRSLPFKKETNKLKFFWETSYFILLIPLLMPHQQKYNFLLATPLVIYILYFFITTFKFGRSVYYKSILAIFIISMTLYSPLYGADIIGKFLFRYTQHYRLLTFSTIFLIPVSLYCNPYRLQKMIGDQVKRNKLQLFE